MKRSLRHLLAISLLILTSACQVQDGQESYSQRSEREVATALDEMGVSKGDPVRNLFTFTVNSFNAINDSNLIITAGVHDHYLLVLTSPCFDLRYAFAIALVSKSSTVRQLDTVLVKSLHNSTERCSIKAIYKLDDKEE